MFASDARTRGLAISFGVGLFLIVQLRAQPPTRGAQSGKPVAPGRFLPSPDGLTVHDNLPHVTWLADANFPATQKFGLPIRDSGSMTYPTARKWVAARQREHPGTGYLGHTNRTLPVTPTTDPKCTVARGPHGNSFGFKCENSARGSLYYQGLGLREPNTAVPIPLGRWVHSRIFSPISIGP